MPESRGGGSSGGEGPPSSVGVGMAHTTSWRMEGAEEEEEVEAEADDSSGNSPDIPEVDLKEQKSSSSQTDEWSQIICCGVQTIYLHVHSKTNKNCCCFTTRFTLNWVPAWTESSVADLDWDRDQD